MRITPTYAPVSRTAECGAIGTVKATRLGSSRRTSGSLASRRVGAFPDPWPYRHDVSIVAIDGPTGVGKSTTSRILADRLGATLVLDPVSVSPLLDDYYTGEANPSAALDAELAFLRSRAALLAPDPDEDLVVADFSVLRTAPFSEFLEDPADREQVLAEMRDLLRAGPRIDVLVLLDSEPDSLLQRVRLRDRNAEADLTIDHLVALRHHFDSWREEMLAQADEVIEIDTSEWDPRRPDDVDGLVDRIESALRRARH
jgi:deoxyguanosine kinase